MNTEYLVKQDKEGDYQYHSMCPDCKTVLSNHIVMVLYPPEECFGCGNKIELDENGDVVGWETVCLKWVPLKKWYNPLTWLKGKWVVVEHKNQTA